MQFFVQLVPQRLKMLRCSYMKGRVTLGKGGVTPCVTLGLGHIVRFRANTNLELPKKIARDVSDEGVSLCNAEKSRIRLYFLQRLQQLVSQ